MARFVGHLISCHFFGLLTIPNVAHFQPYITELDLQMANIPGPTIAFLKSAMPEASGDEKYGSEEGETANAKLFSYDAFLSETFSA